METFINLPDDKVEIPKEPKWLVQVDNMIHRLRNPMVDTPNNEKILPAVPKSMEIVKPVAWSLTDDQKTALRINFVKYAAPVLAVFFVSLAAHAPIAVSATLALYAVYQTAADFFTKLQNTTPYLRSKE